MAVFATEYWRHDLDPFIIRISGDLGLRWYGLSYVLGILAAIWILNRWIRQKRVPLGPGEASDLALYGGLGMILGGRLGYCILYAGGKFFPDPLYFFRIWEGGMASHGGILGALLGIGLFARRRHRSFPVLLDQVAAVAPLGIAMGRVANFINGELWGRVTDVKWAVLFPHPEALVNGQEVPRHPSQLYAAFLEGFLLLALLLPLNTRHRRPGLTVACFFLFYGMGRFVDEFWREPDVGQAVFFGWMSKGQAFTIPVFLLGLLLVLWVLRRPANPGAYAMPPAPEETRKTGKKRSKK